MTEYSYRIFLPSNFPDKALLSKYQGRVITLFSPLNTGEILDLDRDGEFKVVSVVREINDLLREDIYPIANLKG